MSCEKFDPQCPGCRPAIIDPRTGKILPADDPVMEIINRVWDASPREEQEAFWRVTVKNSRDPGDLDLMQALTSRMSAKGVN
jgi:hypothetical protein